MLSKILNQVIYISSNYSNKKTLNDNAISTMAAVEFCPHAHESIEGCWMNTNESCRDSRCNGITNNRTTITISLEFLNQGVSVRYREYISVFLVRKPGKKSITATIDTHFENIFRRFNWSIVIIRKWWSL